MSIQGITQGNEPADNGMQAAWYGAGPGGRKSGLIGSDAEVTMRELAVGPYWAADEWNGGMTTM